MSKHVLGLVCFFALSSFAACAQDEGVPVSGDGASVVEPVFEKGKADDLRGVREVATLSIGGRHAGEFDGDFQFFGHIFFAGQKGSKVDVEVIRKGSSSKLDTTLFLYGERESGDWQRLMTDNDDGWGKLSKLKDVEFLGNFRRYMAVVGTADGLGRGKYNFGVTCVSGDCTLSADAAECPKTTSEWIDECVSEGVHDGLGNVADVKFGCTEASQAADYFDVDCNVGAFGTPEGFCNLGFNKFKDVLYPICVQEIRGRLDGGLKLVSLMPSDALQDAVDDESCVFCAQTIEMYKFDDARATWKDVSVAIERLMDNAAFQWQVFEGAQFDKIGGKALQRAVLKELGVDVKEVVTIRLNAEWEPAAGASEFISLDVVMHLESKQLVVLRNVSGD